MAIENIGGIHGSINCKHLTTIQLYTTNTIIRQILLNSISAAAYTCRSRISEKGPAICPPNGETPNLDRDPLNKKISQVCYVKSATNFKK